MRFLEEQHCDPKALSPLTLAFIGDGVYELLVREQLVCEANRPVNALHRAAVLQVRAKAQSAAVKKLLPDLTEEETAVFRRGRNAHTNHTPRNADPEEYHYATGLEALFGYLYLQGKSERLRELFFAIQRSAAESHT